MCRNDFKSGALQRFQHTSFWSCVSVHPRNARSALHPYADGLCRPRQEYRDDIQVATRLRSRKEVFSDSPFNILLTTAPALRAAGRVPFGLQEGCTKPSPRNYGGEPRPTVTKNVYTKTVLGFSKSRLGPALWGRPEASRSKVKNRSPLRPGSLAQPPPRQRPRSPGP